MLEFNYYISYIYQEEMLIDAWLDDQEKEQTISVKNDCRRLVELLAGWLLKNQPSYKKLL